MFGRKLGAPAPQLMLHHQQTIEFGNEVDALAPVLMPQRQQKENLAESVTPYSEYKPKFRQSIL